METIKLANNILKEVVFKGTPFSLALKNEWKFKNVDVKERSLVTAIVGCSLRHYYLFQNGLKKFVENPSEDLMSLVFIGLSNSIFLKKIEENAVRKHVQKVLSQEEFDTYKEIIEKCKETTQLLPDGINVNSLEYLSFRYNTPLWLIKMWNKHYGLNVVYKLLRNNNSPLRTFVKTLSNDEILNPDFAKKDENFYEYLGQGAAKNNPIYETKKMFGYSISMNDMNKVVDIDAVRGIAIYQGYPNNILLDIVSRTSKYIRLDIVTPSFQVLYETRKNIQKYGFENVAIYEANAESLITCISKKVHTLYVMPNNSRFALLRSTPDYFLKIDQTKLDEYLKEEKTALYEGANFVEDGGCMVYCINTVNQKEGRLMIEAFLNDHPEFSLTEEKQKFGFGDGDACFYYAILVKGVARD